VCKSPKYGLQIGTLTVITDCHRKRGAKHHDLYDQALIALEAHGNSAILSIPAMLSIRRLATIYVASKENLADILTKALPRDQHQYLTGQMGLVDIECSMV
jgi:hypothetical protein